MKKTGALIIAFCLCIFLASSLSAGRIPEIIKLDSLSDKYEPVHFDHAKHATLTGNCGSCHHQHGSYSTLPCKDCHTVAPSTFKSTVTNTFLACKSCHSTYDPSNPKVPGLKAAYHSQCLQCHRGMGSVGTDPKGCTEMCHAKKEQNVSKNAAN